jgi:hypothetical protein
MKVLKWEQIKGESLKKKLLFGTLSALLIFGLIYQTTVMLDLQNLRNSVEKSPKNIEISEIAKNVDRATQRAWKFVEVTCPYYLLKYNLSPVFGIPFEVTREITSEKYTYILFENVKGQRTYVAVQVSEYAFCGNK